MEALSSQGVSPSERADGFQAYERQWAPVPSNARAGWVPLAPPRRAQRGAAAPGEERASIAKRRLRPQNCARSVLPASASVDASPPVITFDT